MEKHNELAKIAKEIMDLAKGKTIIAVGMCEVIKACFIDIASPRLIK